MKKAFLRVGFWLTFVCSGVESQHAKTLMTQISSKYDPDNTSPAGAQGSGAIVLTLTIILAEL